MTLEHLLVMAGVPRWHQHHIFGDARLVGATLYVPDPDLAALIGRCYLAQMIVEFGSTITITLGKSPHSAPATPPKSAFKKAYRGEIEKLHQGDML